MKNIKSHSYQLFSIFSFLIFFIVGISSANAAVNLNIKNGEMPKTKILFYGFENSNPEIKSSVDEILERITNNLKTTDLFEVSRKSGPSDLLAVSLQDKNKSLLTEQVPDFNKYNAMGIAALLLGDVSMDLTGNLEIRVRLWDILDERQLFGKYYSAGASNKKKMANLISDEIFKSVTGEKAGHFNSQIVYIAESGNVFKRKKRIAVVDFDGENKRYLTNGDDLVLTPVFSKKPKEIFFLRFFGSNPQIYDLDIKNNITNKVGSFRYTTLAPAVHPTDPNLILFTMINNGNSDVYEMNLLTNHIARLTNHPAIDTTPSYSPDGRHIIFSSDRDGSQQIYVMNSDGSGLKKISTDKGSYSKPLWSPDGKLIAFTKIKSNQFGIGLMTPDGRNEKIISSGYLVEGAKWSPNGRYLIYSRKNGAFGSASVPKLYIIDILTGYEREFPTADKEGATDPDWAELPN